MVCWRMIIFVACLFLGHLCRADSLRALLLDNGYIRMKNTHDMPFPKGHVLQDPAREEFLKQYGGEKYSNLKPGKIPEVQFVTYLSSRGADLKSKRVIFDKVLQNDGFGYDPETGVFVAPAEGTYKFTLTAVGHHHQSEGKVLGENDVHLVIDGNVIPDGAAVQSKPVGTKTFILPINKESHVLVISDYVGRIQKYKALSFSGQLMKLL